MDINRDDTEHNEHGYKKTPSTIMERFAVLPNKAEVVSKVFGAFLFLVFLFMFTSPFGYFSSSANPPQEKSKEAVQNFRTFTRADFFWDEGTTLYKDLIVKAVNKIHRENTNCAIIDPGSVSLSPDKSTDSNPVFYVMCGLNIDIFNVYFSKSDIESGKTFLAAGHIDQNEAIHSCRQYAISQATHPSSVDFSVFNISVREHPNGRTTIWSTFTAKNSFNLDLSFKIRCLLDENGLIEGNISELR